MSFAFECDAMTRPDATPHRRIAIVVPAFGHGGGVPAVARFLREVLLRSGRYAPEIISLCTSWREAHNVRFGNPSSWFRGPQIVRKRAYDIEYLEVGSVLSEFEIRRYRPRRQLTALLDSFDLIQLVTGTPAQADVARNVRTPVFLQVATIVRWERRALLAGRSPRALWGRLMTRIVARLDEIGARVARTVFVENQLMHSWLSQRLGPERVVFSPPGVDTAVFKPAAVPGDCLLSVGRFDDPRKNVRLLFDAYCALRARMVNAPRLVLAGYSGPAPADWSYARALGIDGFVDVRCDLSLAELADVYRAARLFVLTSDEEGLGLAILEAMACGVPIVSTRSGGPETSVVDGETGCLVPRGDAGAITDALHRLLGDPSTLEKMGRAARRRAEAHFSMEAAGRRFLEHYDALFAAPAGGTGEVQPPRPIAHA